MGAESFGMNLVGLRVLALMDGAGHMCQVANPVALQSGFNPLVITLRSRYPRVLSPHGTGRDFGC